MMSIPSHDEIVARLRDGDPEAAKLVYGWIVDTVRYLTRGSALDAEDLAGECFLAVFKGVLDGSYRGAGLRAYIQVICRNKIGDRWREVRRNPDVNPAQIDEASDPAPTGDERLRSVLRAIRLRRVWGQLNAKDRMAVAMWAEKRDLRDIAAALDASYGATRTRICKAVKFLRSLAEQRQKP
ncbi:MAG TPA: sigma-70 family RNA polymerase sigma factor [bacterium]|nr:sigma-70 family RNA polymerase sigma factor [bacterium]